MKCGNFELEKTFDAHREQLTMVTLFSILRGYSIPFKSKAPVYILDKLETFYLRKLLLYQKGMKKSENVDIFNLI